MKTQIPRLTVYTQIFPGVYGKVGNKNRFFLSNLFFFILFVLKELAIYAPKISTAPYVMVFLGADAFTRASGRGLNPGN